MQMKNNIKDTEFEPSIDQIIKRVTIDKLDNSTVSIYNGHLNFMYTIADSIVKNELKGKYRYMGGLQCNFEKDSENYKLLEEKLCVLAEKILK